MKKFILPIIFLMIWTLSYAQYIDPWSEPILITDTVSYNSSPAILVFETEAYLFYEKSFSTDGPTKIYYRDIKNMGEEIELFGDPIISYRNPLLSLDYSSNYEQVLFFESDQNGNFDIYALTVDEFMNFGNAIQLTFTSDDEGNTDYTTWYNQLIWDVDGEIRAAQLEFQDDTLFLQNTMTIDFQGCFQPKCCNSRIVYHKTMADSTAVYYSDWDYSFSQWGSPQILDNQGTNSFCHCSKEAWGYVYEDVIIYEKEGNIYNYYYDEFYQMDFPEFNDNMHEPNSIIYYLPVDYLPSPVFVTFRSPAVDNDEIYIYATEFSGYPENISNDALPNANPVLLWGWYAPNPCGMYLLDIWESQQNGFQPLYLSKCSLYVCGGLDEKTKQELSFKVNPNPFSNTLKISYQSYSSEQIFIEILNSQGQLIQKLNRKITDDGWNEFLYSPGVNIPKGILYIKLSQGNKQLFRKVIYN